MIHLMPIPGSVTEANSISLDAPIIPPSTLYLSIRPGHCGVFRFPAGFLCASAGASAARRTGPGPLSRAGSSIVPGAVSSDITMRDGA